MKNDENQSYWRKCTTCKKQIGFSQVYWVCSVSTCNRVRTDLIFCNLNCFDAHVPVMNHRDAGAFERKAPSEQEFKTQHISQGQKVNQIENYESRGLDNEILVVVSKVKSYIRIRSGMNTSDSVMDLLSLKIRDYANQAIESAKSQGRKTVLDRDIL